VPVTLLGLIFMAREGLTFGGARRIASERGGGSGGDSGGGGTGSVATLTAVPPLPARDDPGSVRLTPGLRKGAR
jgi:hypothetical protein